MRQRGCSKRCSRRGFVTLLTSTNTDISRHSEQAAARGEPSYVWRSGQERRLAMVNRWAPLEGARVLEVGVGVGMYLDQIARRYTPHVTGVDIEFARVARARALAPGVAVAAAERLPYASNTFDVVLSNEVIEHVADDRANAREMVRVLKPGGRLVVFCPNRGYPFETHGVYWRGRYRFGNIPLVNWLPDSLRNRLAPHVRVYTARGLRCLFDGAPVRVVHHGRIFGGYDNIVRRAPALGRWVRGVLYWAEGTPLRVFGLSHLLVVEKVS
ncbi:MAG: class I SAM-dependent methyltransferase [Anaerolineae bacterium]|nr:class I SAM-dependent methyltransferase [Anaerolineae bacterium]